jgi:hypothetical protein
VGIGDGSVPFIGFVELILSWQRLSFRLPRSFQNRNFL